MIEFLLKNSAAFGVEVIIKAAIVVGAAWAVTLIGHKLSAAFRHWVWCGAFAALLVLPVVVVVAPSWRVVPGWTRDRQTYEAVRMPQEIAKPVATPEPAAQVLPRMAPLPQVADAVGVPAAATITQRPRRAIDWLEVGGWAWMIGLAMMALPLVGAAIYLRVMERRGRHVEGDEWGFAEALETIGIRRRVVMVESGRAKMPLTFGVVRPTIVVPAESAGWDQRKRRMVLMHELMHVKRLDAGTQMAAALVRAVYWFHPLVWLAYRQMGIERERACDDRVLSAGAEPAAYAETLVEIAAGLRGRVLFTGGIAMARRSTLETRVRAVLDGGCNRKLVRAGGMALAAVMALAALPLGALRGADEKVTGGKSQESASVKKLPSGATVELVGISTQVDSGPWWAADGTPVMPKVDRASLFSAQQQQQGRRFGGGGSGGGAGGALAGEPIGRFGGGRVRVGSPMRNFLFHFTNLPADTGVILFDTVKESSLNGELGTIVMVSGKQEGNDFVRTDGMATVMVESKIKQAYVRVGIAEGKWEHVLSGAPGESGKGEKARYVIGEATLPNGVAFDPSKPIPEQVPGVQVTENGVPVEGQAMPAPQSEIRITHSADLSGKRWRIVAIGTDGKDHVGVLMHEEGSAGNLQTDVAEFAGLTADQIKSVRLETQQIDWVEFTDLPMEPGEVGKTATGNPDEAAGADPAAEAVRARLQASHDAELAKSVGEALAPAAKKYYYVMGMVERGGVYELVPGKITVLQAAAAAGVKNENQGLLVVRVLRAEDGKQKEVLREDLSRLMDDMDKQVTMQDGDVVSINVDRALKQAEMDKLRQKKQELMVRLAAIPKNGGGVNEITEIQHGLQNLDTRLDELEKLPAQ